MITNGKQVRQGAPRIWRHQHAGFGITRGVMIFHMFLGTASAFQMNTDKLFCRRTPYHTSDDTELQYSKNGDGAIEKAYNEYALSNFHMMTQAQKIRDYSAMYTFVDTKSLWNSASHDSFVRNGLADFVPPMTGELNVLVIGGQSVDQPLIDNDTYALDGEVDANAMPDPGSVQASVENIEGILMSPKMDNDRSSQQMQKDSSCSFLASIFDHEINFIGSDSKDSALEFITYDCIMDEGLIAHLVRSTTDNTNISSKNKQDVARLLFQATKRIREMGFFVANTSPMTSETKEYLEMLGEMLGLQWEFDLDGISDENLSVSVARKFGTCPDIGWQTLARTLRE